MTSGRSDEFPIVAAAIPAHPRAFVADTAHVRARSREQSDREHGMVADEHQRISTLRTRFRIAVGRLTPQVHEGIHLRSYGEDSQDRSASSPRLSGFYQTIARRATVVESF